ncbi:hypothetical protein B0H21DRAFT_316248 [Amylocystis lapponica]|nr:hypothetical protein B0H21DRAFT_316248 [Amylocystis lapponica]
MSPSVVEGCDFTIRSIPDGDSFRVDRRSLEAASDVFRDMFACCDSGYVMNMTNEDNQALDLPESASTLTMLLRLVDMVPESYQTSAPVDSSHIWAISTPDATTPDATIPDATIPDTTIPDATIPFPLIPSLISLADKYALSQSVVHNLHSHLAAYASIYPLRVYGYASQMGLNEVAGEASMHLLQPPLSTYSLKDIAVISSAEAYHKLALLHDHRVRCLRDVLLGESIFPHGYGKCTKHAKNTTALWEQRKKSIADRIGPATDLAAEMAQVQREAEHCHVCYKGCKAAVSMLAYKADKIPKRVDRMTF